MVILGGSQEAPTSTLSTSDLCRFPYCTVLVEYESESSSYERCGLEHECYSVMDVDSFTNVIFLMILGLIVVLIALRLVCGAKCCKDVCKKEKPEKKPNALKERYNRDRSFIV